MKLFDGHFQLSELSTELLQELGLTLLHAQELLLYKPDACQQALLHRLHSCGRVGEGTLQLALERLLVGAERLEVALEDAGDIVVGLEHLVLQRFEAVRLPGARCLSQAARSRSCWRQRSRTSCETSISVMAPAVSLTLTMSGACARSVGERERARARAPAGSDAARLAPAPRRDPVCIAAMVSIPKAGGLAIPDD